MYEQKKSPYKGRLLVMLALAVPSILVTWMAYAVISKYQPQYGHDMNFASAKVLGCSIGLFFHFACMVAGVFAEDAIIVINRLREFFSDLFASPKLAFTWYWRDIKDNGIAYWLEVGIVIANIIVGVVSLLDFLELWKMLPR